MKPEKSAVTGDEMIYYISKWINVMGAMKIAHVVYENCREAIVVAEFYSYCLRGAGYIAAERIKIIGELENYSLDHWTQRVYEAMRAKPDGGEYVYNGCCNGGGA